MKQPQLVKIIKLLRISEKNYLQKNTDLNNGIIIRKEVLWIS